MERIEILKDEGGWSFRQPKKQRSLGGTGKSHWDFLIDEMVSCVGSNCLPHLIGSLSRNGCASISVKKGDGRLRWLSILLMR